MRRAGMVRGAMIAGARSQVSSVEDDDYEKVDVPSEEETRAASEMARRAEEQARAQQQAKQAKPAAAAAGMHDTSRQDADAAKALGNKLFAEGKFREAAAEFSKGGCDVRPISARARAHRAARWAQPSSSCPRKACTGPTGPCATCRWVTTRT